MDRTSTRIKKVKQVGNIKELDSAKTIHIHQGGSLNGINIHSDGSTGVNQGFSLPPTHQDLTTSSLLKACQRENGLLKKIVNFCHLQGCKKKAKKRTRNRSDPNKP